MLNQYQNQHQEMPQDILLIDSPQLEAVDRCIRKVLKNYYYINVALVKESKVVLTKSYGHDRLERSDEYASVSKVILAMRLCNSLKKGRSAA